MASLRPRRRDGVFMRPHRLDAVDANVRATQASWERRRLD
jgi:hypothetical protein